MLPSTTMWIVIGALVVLAGIVAVLVPAAIRRRYITPMPNEFVVHTRRGKVKHIGLGVSFFYSSIFDTYVLFPSAVQKVLFGAMQVTKENQGIEVSGFVIWRIVDLEKAYKALDTSGATTVEKTSIYLGEICESVVRHSVANMTIEEVLRKRESIMGSLKEQLTEVVGGWGLDIETVEIKEVKILSETVFGNMQTTFREKLRLEAETQRLLTEKEIAEKQLLHDKERRIFAAAQEEESRAREIEKEREVFLLGQEVEKTKLEKGDELETLKARQAFERMKAAKAADIEKEKLNREQEELSGETQITRLSKEAQAKASALRIETDAEVERRTSLAELRKLELLREIEAEIERIKAEGAITPPTLHKAIIDKLPELARAMSLGDVKWINLAGDKTPVSNLANTLASLLSVAESFGIDFRRVLGSKAEPGGQSAGGGEDK